MLGLDEAVRTFQKQTFAGLPYIISFFFYVLVLSFGFLFIIYRFIFNASISACFILIFQLSTCLLLVQTLWQKLILPRCRTLVETLSHDAILPSGVLQDTSDFEPEEVSLSDLNETDFFLIECVRNNKFLYVHPKRKKTDEYYIGQWVGDIVTCGELDSATKPHFIWQFQFTHHDRVKLKSFSSDTMCTMLGIASSAKRLVAWNLKLTSPHVALFLNKDGDSFDEFSICQGVQHYMIGNYSNNQYLQFNDSSEEFIFTSQTSDAEAFRFLRLQGQEKSRLSASFSMQKNG